MAESFNQGCSICFESLSPYVLKEHNAFPIDKRRFFFEKFVLNLLKLPRVDVSGDHLAIIKKLIIYNTSCCSPGTKQNLLLMEIRAVYIIDL